MIPKLDPGLQTSIQQDSDDRLTPMLSLYPLIHMQGDKNIAKSWSSVKPDVGVKKIVSIVELTCKHVVLFVATAFAILGPLGVSFSRG